MAASDPECPLCGEELQAGQTNSPVPPARATEPAAPAEPAAPEPEEDWFDEPVPYQPAYRDAPLEGGNVERPRNQPITLIISGLLIVALAGLIGWFITEHRHSATPEIAVATGSAAAPTVVPITTSPITTSAAEPVETTDDTQPSQFPSQESPEETSPAAPISSPDGLVTVVPTVGDQASDDVLTDVVKVLDTYFSGVNTGHLLTAYAAFSSREKARNPYAHWRSNIADSSVENVVVESVNGAVDSVGEGPITADVAFRSHQPGSQGVNPGETCTDWSLTYTLIPDGSNTAYLIDAAKPVPGQGHSAC